MFEPGSRLSDSRGYRLDVAEAVSELSVPVVRWPGGCFVSSYHWRDGVGRTRRPAFDKAWRVEESNTFGTDEFVTWCRMVGAEPYICTNAGTGTPEEMSDWVEYCNLESEGRFAHLRRESGFPEPHGVRFTDRQYNGAISPSNYNPVSGTAHLVRQSDKPAPPLVLELTYIDEGEIQLCESQGCPGEVPLMSTQWIYALLALLLGSSLFYVRYRRVGVKGAREGPRRPPATSACPARGDPGGGHLELVLTSAPSAYDRVKLPYRVGHVVSVFFRFRAG